MKTAIKVILLVSVCGWVHGQPTIRDESKVQAYTLPEVLKMQSGELISNQKQWESRRRSELIRLFEDHVYGKTPGMKIPLRFVTTSVDHKALNGKATRKEVTVFFGPEDAYSMDLLLYLPNHVKKPAPVFLGLNFAGNQVVHPDTGIKISKRWIRDGSEPAIRDHHATEASRGSQAGDWPVEEILAKGYGLVTAFCGDLQPDRMDGAAESVQKLFKDPVREYSEWGAIGTWAWGLSRALDYLETDKQVNARQVAVIGHSRLGKAALWAGAQDTRFAMVVSNNSGEGGAAITRRKFGETIGIITNAFPYWFCENYKQYAGREEELPIDFHELIALIAPRPVYVASASEDWWADPKGEFLSAYHATPVFTLYGLQGLTDPTMPEANHPVGSGSIGYHLRQGGHTMTVYDWQQYLRFADKWFRK